MLNKVRDKGHTNKEKALLAMENAQLRSGFGKPISNPVTCVLMTLANDEVQAIFRGKDNVKSVRGGSLVKRNTDCNK